MSYANPARVGLVLISGCKKKGTEKTSGHDCIPVSALEAEARRSQMAARGRQRRTRRAVGLREKKKGKKLLLCRKDAAFSYFMGRPESEWRLKGNYKRGSCDRFFMQPSRRHRRNNLKRT